MLQTLERKPHTFDAQVLTPAQFDALRALAGPAGLPMLETLRPALDNGQIVGDFAGQEQLQVLTPPRLRGNYTQLRNFLRLSLRWAIERYASYHVWAVQVLDLENLPACEDLCAQYLSTGLTLRAVLPLKDTDGLMIYSARGLAHWREPLRRLHLNDPALPRVLERGYAAADFGWSSNGMELLVRPL